jgi:flagellar L-ring protein precursor FlgH
VSAKGGANSSTFNGVITVRCWKCLLNGNLLVSWGKRMLIEDTRFIRFSGVVNPRTVSANNTDAFDAGGRRASNATAKATSTKAQTMGWLQHGFLMLPF